MSEHLEDLLLQSEGTIEELLLQSEETEEWLRAKAEEGLRFPE